MRDEHVYPVNDIAEHFIEGPGCRCNPELRDVGDHLVYIHKAFDLREWEEHLTDGNDRDCWCQPDMIFEYDGREVWVHKGYGEELAPAQVIAKAVYNVLVDDLQ